MANTLGRNIKSGEIVVVELPAMPLRRFICYSGFGMFAETEGCTIFGEWADRSGLDWISGHAIDRRETETLESSLLAQYLT